MDNAKQANLRGLLRELLALDPAARTDPAEARHRPFFT
jgi:hypothetical protein